MYINYGLEVSIAHENKCPIPDTCSITNYIYIYSIYKQYISRLNATLAAPRTATSDSCLLSGLLCYIIGC